MAFLKKGLQQLKASHLILRFFFGGVACVLAGLVDNRYGPLLSGLFFAFPAMVPASLSIALKNQTPRDALEITFGASAGAVGLAGAGFFLWRFGSDLPRVSALGAAVLIWLATAMLTWKLVFSGGPSDNSEN